MRLSVRCVISLPRLTFMGDSAPHTASCPAALHLGRRIES
jgi:hypothetical protein